MLTGLHFLLTYACNFECDHCFVYSSPRAKGTFTLGQIRKVLDQAVALGTIKGVYFEGGEPALYYATMREGIRLACERGFSAGIVTNAYWALSEEDALAWLKPLAEAGLSRISVSDDDLHYGDEPDTPPKRALAAAAKLGISAGTICTRKPTVVTEPGKAPAVAGGVMFRGRAIEKLAPGLPLKAPSEFTTCPHEKLDAPERVHLDAFGHVHLCQGVTMGNLWETPLPELVPNYWPPAHPIAGPLLRGGPAALAKESGFRCADGYIDACHFCYAVRRALLDRFPQYLAPRQLYGCP